MKRFLLLITALALFLATDLYAQERNAGHSAGTDAGDAGARTVPASVGGRNFTHLFWNPAPEDVNFAGGNSLRIRTDG